MRKLMWCAVALVATTGCGLAGAANRDVSGVTTGLASSVTLGQSAMIAVDAISGSGSTRCVAAATDCADTYPCSAEVTIEYGSGCPLPLGGEATGTVVVTGEWDTQDSATLDFTYTEVQVGDRGGVVASATTIDVSRTDDVVTFSYTGSQATARGLGTLATTSSWDVSINDSGTPGDPSDDSYTVDGTDTRAGGIGAEVIEVEAALITPDCRLNPVGGTASITQNSLTNIRIDDITFHAECDGTADLEPASGNVRPVDLDFLAD